MRFGDSSKSLRIEFRCFWHTQALARAQTRVTQILLKVAKAKHRLALAEKALPWEMGVVAGTAPREAAHATYRAGESYVTQHSLFFSTWDVNQHVM